MSHDDTPRRTGRWISDGGRLHWQPFDADDAADEIPADALSADDAAVLPEGAPQSLRARVALAWLHRQHDLEGEIVGELAVIERDRYRARDAESPRRRGQEDEIDPVTLDIAEHNAAAQWYDDAATALLEEAERSGERALVEWYLWLLAMTPADPPPGVPDSLAMRAMLGRRDAWERTRHQVERIVAPEED